MASYLWACDNGVILPDATLQNPVFDGFPVGDTICTLTVTDGNTCVDTESTTVRVNPNTIATASNTGPVCEFDVNGNRIPVTLNGGPNGMASYVWACNNGVVLPNPNLQNPVFDGFPVGDTICTLTITDLNGCQDRETTTVTVFANPIATASNTGPVCEFDVLGSRIPVMLIGGPNGMASYAWVCNNGVILPNPNLQNPVFDGFPVGNTVCTLTVTDANGCQDTQPTTVTVRANPSADITAVPPEVCDGSQGNTASVSDAGLGAIYAWNVIGGIITQDSGTNIVYSVPLGTPSPVTISVTVTDPNGCITLNPGEDVVVRPLPADILPTANPPTACELSEVTLTCGPNDPSLTNYAWTCSDGTNNLVGREVTFIPNVIAPTGVVCSCTFEDVVTGCPNPGINNSVNFAVIPNTVEPATTAGNDGPACFGDTVNLSSQPNGMASYSWSCTNAVVVANVQNPSSNQFPVGDTTCTVTVSDGVCQGTEPTTVTINANPVAGAQANPVQACDAVTQVQLTATPDAVGLEYAWACVFDNPNNPIFTSNLRVANFTPDLPAGSFPDASVRCTVTVTETATTCSDTAFVDLVVNEQPVATASNSTIIDPTCQGEVVTLTGGPDNMTTYTWNCDNGVVLPNVQNPTSDQFPVGDTTCTLTVSLGGCMDTSDPTTVTINTNPFTQGNATNTGPVCSTAPDVTLTEPDNEATATYDWSCDDGTTALGRVAIVTLNPIGAPDSEESIVCTVTADDTGVGGSGCAGTDTTTVRVITGDPEITVDPTDAEALQEAGCVASFTVTALRAGGADDFTWEYSLSGDPGSFAAVGGAGFNPNPPGTLFVNTEAAAGYQGGFYRCVVCNPCGGPCDTSAPAFLLIRAHACDGFCGDGFVSPIPADGEECDDGNMNNTDGCRNNCTLP